MNKPTHVMGGLTAGVAVYEFVVPHLTTTELSTMKVVATASVLAGSFIGSVLPDIDKKNSFIGRRVKVLSFILEHTVGHRGPTHAPLFTLGLSALLGYGVLYGTEGWTQSVLLFFVLGLFAGLLSHLFLDMLTKGGIPVLYPLSSKHYSLLPFKTGGIGEYIVSFACIVLMVFMLGIPDMFMSWQAIQK